MQPRRVEHHADPLPEERLGPLHQRSVDDGDELGPVSALVE
jgi:hypothetical protein